jgi:signal transduction histidine kinase
VGGVFLPYSFLLLLLASRSEHWIVHVVGLVGDLTILFLFHRLLPAAHIVVMFAYLLILAFHASLGGILAGLVVTAAIMGLVLHTEQTVYQGRGVDAYTLVEYGVVLVAGSGLLHAVTREQRRANQRLEALLGSLRLVSSSLELEDVLDALARTVCRSLGAEYAKVELLDGDFPDWRGHESVVGCSRTAVTMRRTVVIGDARTEPDRLRAAPRVRSVISVPLLDGDRAIGVLNAGFRQPWQIGDGQRDLVSAYAEQVTTAVIRARSYERAKRAEGEVKHLNAVLERRVQERTAELERIQAELHVQLEVTRRQASALGEMSRRIASARDEERRRLARDLHDGIQQQLVVLGMNLSLRPGGEPEEDRILREVEEELDRIIERMREVAQDIYPSILLDRGLTAALRSYAGRLPLPTRLTAYPDPLPRLPPTVEGTAYFVICEAVTNALKHSQGTELDISLALDDEYLELSVRDDGRGFSEFPATGRGLVYMRDRVRSFGGDVIVRPAYPRGVEVQAAIPIGTDGDGSFPSGSPPGAPPSRYFAEGRTGPRSPAG